MYWRLDRNIMSRSKILVNKPIRLSILALGTLLALGGMVLCIPFLIADAAPQGGGKPTGASRTDPPYNTYTLTGWSPDGKQIIIHHVRAVWGIVEQDYVIDIDSGMMEETAPDWIGEDDSVSSRRNGQSIVIADPEQLTHFPELEVMLATPFQGSRRIYPPIRLESLDCPSIVLREESRTVTAVFSNSALVNHEFDVTLLAPSLQIDSASQVIEIPAGKSITVSWQVRATDTIQWAIEASYSSDYLLELFKNDIASGQRWLVLRSGTPLVGIEPLRYGCYMRVGDIGSLSPNLAQKLSVASAIVGAILISLTMSFSDVIWVKNHFLKINLGTIIIALVLILVLLCAILTLLGPSIGSVFEDRSSYIY
jgi:hypothetical protein